MNRPKLLLADDHTMFSQGLRGLLEDDFELVGSVGNGQDLLEAAMRLDPDVIVLDISMPVLNGFDAARALKKQGARAKIVFLTMHSDPGLVAEALRCGALGYVVKQSAGDELISVIRQVAQGKTCIPKFTPPEANHTMRESEGHSLNLTPRQREVLRLIAKGLTMKKIAAELGISTRTAETHKYETMEAIGVQTTAELVQYAIKLGLL
jgi:DNA-binding NarL/FixJ family response regulator